MCGARKPRGSAGKRVREGALPCHPHLDPGRGARRARRQVARHRRDLRGHAASLPANVCSACACQPVDSFCGANEACSRLRSTRRSVSGPSSGVARDLEQTSATPKAAPPRALSRDHQPRSRSARGCPFDRRKRRLIARTRRSPQRACLGRGDSLRPSARLFGTRGSNHVRSSRPCPQKAPRRERPGQGVAASVAFRLGGARGTRGLGECYGLPCPEISWSV